ncbi:MAG: phage protein [Firmicutes bacterium]|nr:phage protein [Bacillota bacterium]
MKGHGEKFTRKQEVAIVALLMAPNIAEAAKQTGISESTLWRWLQNESFQQRYRKVKSAALGQAVAQIHAAASSAALTLKDIACSEENPASSRVSAAKSILELAFKSHETEDLEYRMAELEKIMEEVFLNEERKIKDQRIVGKNSTVERIEKCCGSKKI